MSGAIAVRYPRVVLAECANCGAPLDVKGDPTFVDCRYCGRSNRVKAMRTLSVQTPPTWKPPPQWQPPAHAPADSSRALRYAAAGTAGAAGITGCVTAGAIVAALAAVGAAVVVAVIPAVQSEDDGVDFSGDPFAASAWDGTRPFSCGGNEVVTLSNVEADLPGQTVITVSDNCQLTLVNASISGADGVVGAGNGRVVIRNTNIRTTGAGIRLDGNRLLEVRGSEVVASRLAIDIGGNTQATIDGSTVQGSPRAITERDNASATVTNTTVR